MFNGADIAGEMCQFDEPDWQPLHDIVGVKLADWFMWMCEIELEDGVRVHAYKHITTRCYFHLGADGRAFAYIPSGRYREIDRRGMPSTSSSIPERTGDGSRRQRSDRPEAGTSGGGAPDRARRRGRSQQARPGRGAAAQNATDTM